MPKPKTQTQAPDLKSKLEKYLKEMNPWESKPIIHTPYIHIELIKLPERRTKRGARPERLALHIKTADAFKGMIIESSVELESLIEDLSYGW